METVEVWMWIVAGILIGSIIFATAYSLMANHVKKQELLQASQGYNQLYELINTVCLSGIDAMETQRIIFPYIVERIWIEDETGKEEEGKRLCYKIKDKNEFCQELKLCSAKMRTISFTEKTNLFYLIQKALGKKEVANIEFKVQKSGLNSINITWKRRYVK